MLPVMLTLALSAVVAVEDLPLIDRNTTAYQTSTHNKRGLNNDAGYFLYEAEDAAGATRAVLLDAVGPGAVRNLWGLGGHDLRIEADGRVIVDASQTDFFTGLVPGFPKPLVFKGLVASGPWKCQTHWSYVPIGFRERCIVSTSNPRPFAHVVAERYRNPRQVKPWREGRSVAELTRLWESCGRDPKPWRNVRKREGRVVIPAGQGSQLLAIPGAGAIGALSLRLSPRDPEALRQVRLLGYWDGEAEPSLSAPVGHFFGAGVRWQEIPSLLVGVSGEWGYSYFPMPFWEDAALWLVNGSTREVVCDWRVEWRSKPYPREHAGYFRTWFHKDESTPLGRDYQFLSVAGRGHFIGVVQTLIGGHYCEGDERFYIDGSRSPAFYGTGTEDYYMAACWPNIDVHTPFHGTVGDVAREAEEAGAGERGFYNFRACYYRFHLDAPVRFESEIFCGIEHGGVNDTHSSYTSLAYYYSQDRRGLIETDRVVIGDAASEAAHGLSAPGAPRGALRDFFEGDYDDVPVAFQTLSSHAPVRVSLDIAENNLGVRLRRVRDQLESRQWAEVFVDGRRAGDWYDPDGNPFKRLAETEFEIPPRLVAGKRRIEVEFRPRAGHPAWSLLELTALSHVADGGSTRTLRLERTPYEE